MMRAFVVELPLGEPARFNPSQLEDLCRRIGEARAETEVAMALERIVGHLAGLGPLARTGRMDRLKSLLNALICDADLIGMATLARVAADVRQNLESGDATGFAATLARLERVGDRSIHAAWDLEDLSG